MARLKDVADLAQVSTATASRVLTGRDYVSEDLRVRVLAAAEHLNYSPNGIARSMSERRTRTLGLVVSDVTNPYFTAVARAVEDVGEAGGYGVMLCNTDEEPSKERGYLSMLREKRADGILLALASDDSSHVRSLIAAGTNIVLLDRVASDLDVPSITVDNAGGMQRAVDYLIGLGHRRIAIVTGQMSVSVAGERLLGYTRALDQANVPIDESLILGGAFTEAGGYSAGSRLMELSDLPTAIVSSNNLMTTGLLMALRERGVRFPDDVSVISFDDLPYFRLLEAPLTVVAQPMYEVGRVACEVLLKVIQGVYPDSPESQRIQLPTELVIRESCRVI